MIDPPAVPSRGRLWSHVASDTSYDELHAFANDLGIPERSFDRDAERTRARLTLTLGPRMRSRKRSRI